MTKLEMIKKLEYMVAFQSDCLARGNWEDFDRAENLIKNLEINIIQSSEK